MLGIRYFKSIAIDLWQGVARDFVSDFTIKLAGNSTPQALEIITQGLNNSENSGLRHVSIEIPATYAPQSSQEILSHLQTQLKTLLPKKIKRITFVLPSMDHYDLYQEVLFKHFSDDKEV